MRSLVTCWKELCHLHTFLWPTHEELYWEILMRIRSWTKIHENYKKICILNFDSFDPRTRGSFPWIHCAGPDTKRRLEVLGTVYSSPNRRLQGHSMSKRFDLDTYSQQWQKYRTFCLDTRARNARAGPICVCIDKYILDTSKQQYIRAAMQTTPITTNRSTHKY